ncbi:MAG TPA: MFS transporter [Micromonosporaceae bacterium]|nr:MFS transporter [Micromonosporaceae bacterium]
MATDAPAPPAPGHPDPADGELSTRRERVGWYFYDFANSAFPTTVVTVFLGPYLTSIAQRAAGCDSTETCRDAVIHPLGLSIAPGSLFPYAVSLSVFLTVFVLPLVGAIADRSSRKKELMALFAYVGAAATIGFLFLTGDRYMLGTGLFLVANIAFGASIVVYYSFLPQLAGPDQRDSVSSIGWAIGYLGGGTLLLLNVAAVLGKGALGLSTGDVARYSLVSAGVWWAAFTTIPLLRLRNRPATAAPVGPGRSTLTEGFVQLWHTLRSLRAYPLTLLFLAAYLIYNDGIQTVIALAGTYGTEELGLPDTVLVPTILMVQFLAFAGALGLGAVARRIGAWKTVIGTLVLWIVVLIAAYLLPAQRTVPFVLLGGAIGIVLGGSQALSRSLFSQLIPKGKEGEYFGLYEISDKGTSWLGPLLFGLAYDITRSYRVAIISLLVFFVVGLAILVLVPMRRAIVAAGNTPPRVL